MKDYGSEYPLTRRLPSLSTIGAVLLMAVMIFVGQSIFLLTLADVASGPAVHSVSPLSPPSSSPGTLAPTTLEPIGDAKRDGSGLLASSRP